MKKLKILSLDVASVCGWATSTDIYGTWNMKTIKDESMGMKLIRFKAKITEVCAHEEIELIVYERPAGQHANSIIHQAKMIGVLEKFCEENDIEYRAFSASEIKKFATGKGNCGKAAMIEAAKEKYEYDGDDDNEADAIHMLELCKDQLKI